MSHLENYYKYYNLSRVPARILKGEEHYNLYKKPLKEKTLKDKTANRVLNGFVKIYRRNRIKPPTHRLETDSGSEFTNDQVRDFFLNSLGRNPPDIPTGSPKVSKKTELLSEGTHVRVKLDEPISVLGNKLHGKFRTGDIRWNPNIRVIKKMILSPEQPPTYLLDGPHGRLGVSRCAYTRKELQIVPENEHPPPDSVIRGQPERFVPERILRHRIRKGQDQYLVKWERYPDTEATWEPADRLEEDVPALIRKFWE
ncbi:chromobox protein homolog 5-like [Rhizophagus irregularis DAOM 181602=DAOM 197198]|nr:chromobox protein homolog 5-like [Rhizophagus irregularis DAOM 181602=DAOM 197198]